MGKLRMLPAHAPGASSRRMPPADGSLANERSFAHAAKKKSTQPGWVVEPSTVHAILRGQIRRAGMFSSP